MKDLAIKYLALLYILLMLSGNCLLANADTNKHSSIKILVNGQSIDYGIFSVFVLPEKIVHIKSQEKKSVKLKAKFNEVLLNTDEPSGLSFKAPAEPGRYTLKIVDSSNSRQVLINVFVLVPYDRMVNGAIEGYQIDEYPHGLYKGLFAYSRPKGFIRVKQIDLNIFVSPHFRLKQFLCKQESGYPKFIALQSKTLSMLEGFLQYVNDSGYPIDTFGVISAYRTPYYNRKIGNVSNSRHVYGDAMDLFIDRDKDGRLDDLDGNKQLNSNDVQVLYRLAIEFQQQSGGIYAGGIGKYQPRSHHGGFVHIDHRGYNARW